MGSPHELSNTSNEPPAGDVPDSSEPPDGGYGWIIVIACFSINFCTWGVIPSCYGIYLSYYLAHDMFPGATSLDFALIGGFQFTFSFLMAPLVTIAARVFGTRAPMLLGIFFLVCGYVAASFSHQIWHLYLSQGVLTGLGIGFIYIPTNPILAQWFKKKRSRASGITGSGAGFGALVASFTTEALIRNISLAWAYRITVIICAVVLLIATLLLKNRNDVVKPTQRGFDTKLLRRLDVILLLSWAFIGTLGYITLLYSLPDFARSIGLSSGQGATTNAILNLGTAIGRPLTGLASDRFGRFEVAETLTLASGLLCFVIWIPAKSYGVLIFFALLNGGMIGIFWVTIGPLSVEVAGLTELQSLLSLAWMSIVLPSTFSEVIALELRRPHSTHEYLFPQIFSGLSYIVASACLFFLHQLIRRRK